MSTPSHRIVAFPSGAPATVIHGPISATWTYTAFDVALNAVAPTIPKAERLALYDMYRPAIETAMRMAAEQATVDAAAALRDVIDGGSDHWDWLIGDGPCVGEARVRR